jgi:hypothetical protein
VIGIINEVYLFFHYSPKRQQFLTAFLSQYCPNNRHEKLQGLCKTRWVERHTCLETFLELYEYVVGVLDAMNQPTLYPEVNSDGKVNNWQWDRETQTKAQGLVTSLKQFTNIAAFIILKNTLDYIKVNASKLQKRDIEVYEAYKMIDTVIEEIQNVRDNIYELHSTWYLEAEEIAEAVGATASRPRTARLQKHKSNVPAESTTVYFKRSL